MVNNLTALFPNLFRAIEIAKLGNHSISVHFSEYKNGFDDYKIIKKYCGGFFNDFVVDGDIKIEIVKPYNYNISIGESLDDISNRIILAKLNKKPNILNDLSKDMLQNAINKLNLSLKQVETIKCVASTIAQLESSENIMGWDIAEAIQYSSTFDAVYNAEEKSMLFGDMITVKIGDLDTKNINDAINYLKSKI